MDFFQKFINIYNKVQKNQHFNKIIPPNDEEWLEFSKKLESFDNSLKEDIYSYIIHYNYLTTGILEPYPYDIKLKGKDIVINYSNLPYILQHIILYIDK